MTTVEFLTFLHSRDIHVRLEGDRLRIDAPKDALVQEIRDQLTSRKPEIIDWLRNQQFSRNPDIAALGKMPRNGSIPLSFAQQGLWFLDQLKPGSAAYVIPLSLRWQGQLNPIVLEKSLTEIVRRHEVLRTIFTSVDGVPSQVILPPGRVTIETIDLTGQTTNDSEAEARRLASANALEPFDLKKGPLLRFRLIRLGAGDHVLLVAIHHIVFDGWSIGVLTAELATLYQAYNHGKVSPLPEPSVQYADFAQWQRQRLDGPVRESQLAYWKRELEGRLSPLELPSDRPRFSIQSAGGAKCTRKITKALTADLKAVAHKEGASLFMVLLAGFEVLLHRLSGQNDILVGTPVAGRNRSETENLLGFFVNTLVMRADFSHPQSFRELLVQVRERTLNAYAHQDIPFEELVGILEPRRDLNRSPLFQVFFNHLNLETPRLQIEGLAAEPFGDYDLESKFDLTIYVSEQGGALQFLLVYNKNLFDEPRMTGLLDQYAVVLENACLNPNRSIHSHSLLPPSIKSFWPDPTRALTIHQHPCVHERFVEQASQNAKRLAIEDATGRWTYGELEQLSGGLAGWLRAHGVCDGEVVAIYGHRSAPLVLAILGVLRAGAAFCILDPAYPDSRLLGNFQATKARAFIRIAGAGDIPPLLRAAVNETTRGSQLTLPTTTSTAHMPELSGVPVLPRQSNPDSLAYVTFTSGTTGLPKCILGSHRPLSHFLEWHSANFGLTNQDRFSLLSGLSHDPLLRDIFTPLSLGGALYVPEPGEILSPGYLATWMRQRRITASHITPALGALLTDSGTVNLPDLRFAFFGGDILKPEVVSQIHRAAPVAQILNFYGTTETPQVMAWHRVDRAWLANSDVRPANTLGPIPIGSPIADVQILVINQAGAVAGPGELGEIFIRTPYLTVGYANDEALTNERYVVNPFTKDKTDRLYRTGDLGRYRYDGVVEFARRADHQIKIRGFRVELGEIEAALSSCHGVHQCTILFSGEKDRPARLIAYVVPATSIPPAVRELRARLEAMLPEYMVPSVFVFIAKIPLTPNGKINRPALPVPTDDSHDSNERGYVAPRNKIEVLMAEIWEEVLSVKKVGVFDHFFELGGHSLLATKLVAKLNAVFRLELPLKHLFIEPTIAALSALIHYNEATQSYSYVSGAHQWKRLVPAQTKGSKIPLFFVGGYVDANETWQILSNLIPHLGLDQPMYGFQPRWLDGHSDGYSSVEDVANDFLTELRIFRPKGPYFLAGDCVGGVVALEMARELKRQGFEVELVVMFDTERPTFIRERLAEARVIYRRAVRITSLIVQMARSTYAVKKQMLGEIFRRKKAAFQPQKASTSAEDHIYRMRVDYRAMIYRYRVRKYPGKIILINNEYLYRVDKKAGWGGMSDGLEIHSTPGEHMTRYAKNGRDIAIALAGCLERARALIKEHL